MTKDFRRLLRLVPPPKKPVSGGSESGFQALERILTLELPSDYKAVINTYGQGAWQKFWYLVNPFSPNKFLNPISKMGNRWGESRIAPERESRGKYPEMFPLPLYPEPGGILPWAMTDNGGTLWWRTVGKPSKWMTIYDPDGRTPQTEWEELEGGCAKIIADSLESGNLLGIPLPTSGPDLFQQKR